MAATQGERIGTVIDGRYKLLERMAEGSMGVVYRAERIPVGKLVAIKFLHAAFSSYPEFAERFDRETQVMSKLAHPHCASVLDFGRHDSGPYIVMEYVAGKTLREMLDDGPLPVATALTLTRQLAAGLAHAHEQGIVHRDIKPANLMITEEIGMGLHLWILDFGLARLRGAIGQNATASHIAVGTPSYMSPEQTVGGAVDARADIYAAGVVLFEMITGERPFQTEDTTELLAMHRGAPVPELAGLVPKSTRLPVGLQALIEKAMAKDPTARFQSAMELADATDALIARGPDASGPPRAKTTEVGSSQILLAHADEDDDEDLVPPRRSPVRALVLLLLLLGVAAGVWYLKVGRSTSTTSSTSTSTSSGSAKPSATPSKPPSVASPPPAPKRPAAPPQLATTTGDAIELVKAGKRELALASLRAMRKQHPKDAEIPFLLGNLDFDSGAYTLALDEYQAALALAPTYRRSAILDGNVIHMLGSAKTRAKAAAFLRTKLGASAAPFLRDAAKNDRDPAVRAQAARVLRTLPRR